jgi:hypothetical protein
MNRKLKLICLIVALAVCFVLVPIPKAFGTDTDGALPFGNNADGVGVLTSLTTGVWNSGFGFEALNHNTTGSLNTATGLRALFSNTEGNTNTANGMMALFSNTTGTNNVAIGAQALVFNIDGSENTAVGTQALSANTAAVNNTATGAFALFSHVSGNANTAYGWHALFSDTSGQLNTAIGAGALASNVGGPFPGSFNTAVGAGALFNSTGGDNTAIGAGALQDNTTGGENIAIGVSALASNETGNNNIALGFFAGIQQTTGSDNIYIGFNMQGTAGESNACYIKSIFGQTAAGGSAVFIDANHKLGTLTSSERYKEDIRQIGTASEALFSLKPVTFRYKKQIDPAGASQFGLVAEEVEKVNPDLVVRDKEGKPYSVRYDQVNAMLLNEFLKEHKKVEELEGIVAALAATVKEQAAQIQKVSTQIEVSKFAPRTVANNR